MALESTIGHCCICNDYCSNSKHLKIGDYVSSTLSKSIIVKGGIGRIKSLNFTEKYVIVRFLPSTVITFGLSYNTEFIRLLSDIFKISDDTAFTYMLES